MTARNDITGDVLQTKNTSDSYREGWDRIFGKKDTKEQPVNKELEEKECKCSTECKECDK